MLRDSTVKTFCAAVARLIHEERVRKEVSMSALAEKAGLSQQMVSYVERGMRNPTLDTLFRMSDALGTDLGHIIQKALKDTGNVDH